MNPSETSWHYADGDEQKGPVPFEQIQREVGTGQLPSHTLVWSEGMPNWLPYRDVAAANLPSPIADTPGSSTLPQGHAPHILHLLGIDHERLTFRYQGRQFRLTDVHGKVIKDVMA